MGAQLGADLLAVAFAHLATGVALLDDAQQVTWANPAFNTLFGQPDCAGMPLRDLMAAGDPSFRLRDGDSLETACRPTDRAPFWAMLRASAMTGAEGSESLLVEITDIDSRRQDELALADSEHRLRVALEAAQQGVWDHDHAHGHKYHSAAWRRMRGMGPADPTPQSVAEWLARIHPDDRARVADYVAQQDAGAFGEIAYNFRERHADGHWIWILSRGRTLDPDADGRPRRIIGVDTDITALKTAEAQLRAEKERLRVTLESIADGVISVDPMGAVSFMNTVAEEMTGWQLPEAAGLALRRVLVTADETDAAALPEAVTERLERNEAFRLNTETRIVGRAGTSFGIRASAASLGGDGAVIVFQDVTDSLALQRQLAYAASHDALTGLPNRTAFEHALDTAIEAARTGGPQVALCFVDIDRFKTVNDSAGHQAGDALLRDIGQLLRSCCRTEDMAARLGGDEFGFLLADCSPETADIAMRRLIDRIASLRFVWNGMRYSVGASIGITMLGADTPDAATALGEADAGCYRAKAGGRGSVSLHDADGLASASAA